MASNPVFPVDPQNLQTPVHIGPRREDGDNATGTGFDAGSIDEVNPTPIHPDFLLPSDVLLNDADDRNSTIAFSCRESASAINQNNLVRPHPS